MTIQLSIAVQNARLAALEAAIGPAPVLKFRSGSPPANAATADSGTALISMTLPNDWLTTPTSGSVVLNGAWTTNSVLSAGTAGHFRIYAADGSTCHLQGTVTATGGGGDMTVTSTAIATGQRTTVSSFNLTEGNS